MAISGKGAEGIDTAARAMAAELAERVSWKHDAIPSSSAGAETPSPSRAGRAPTCDVED